MHEHFLGTAQIFEEPLGLAGKWGPIVREWLDTLLPSDAHLRCRGRVFVLVTALGSGSASSAGPLSSFGSSSSSSSSSSRSSSHGSSSGKGGGSGYQGNALIAWPPLRRVRVTDFSDRNDLLDALMASVSRPNPLPKPNFHFWEVDVGVA